MATTQAVAKFLRVPPLKVRIMARNVIGLPVENALNILSFSPNKTAALLLKVLKSAVANAVTNDKLAVESLVVYRIYVDGGPTLKRWHPRSQGRANPIIKRMSHITVIVQGNPDN